MKHQNKMETILNTNINNKYGKLRNTKRKEMKRGLTGKERQKCIEKSIAIQQHNSNTWAGNTINHLIYKSGIFPLSSDTPSPYQAVYMISKWGPTLTKFCNAVLNAVVTGLTNLLAVIPPPSPQIINLLCEWDLTSCIETVCSLTGTNTNVSVVCRKVNCQHFIPATGLIAEKVDVIACVFLALPIYFG